MFGHDGVCEHGKQWIWKDKNIAHTQPLCHTKEFGHFTYNKKRMKNFKHIRIKFYSKKKKTV